MLNVLIDNCAYFSDVICRMCNSYVVVYFEQCCLQFLTADCWLAFLDIHCDYRLPSPVMTQQVRSFSLLYVYWKRKFLLYLLWKIIVSNCIECFFELLKKVEKKNKAGELRLRVSVPQTMKSGKFLLTGSSLLKIAAEAQLKRCRFISSVWEVEVLFFLMYSVI